MPEELLLGGGGLLSGLVAGLFNNSKVDTSGITNSANNYLKYAKDTFGNTNSAFYTNAKKGQYNTLFDMMMMNNRQKYNQAVSQGINPTAKLMNQWQKASELDATDSANNFALNLFSNGMNNISDAYKTNVNAQTQASSIQAGVSNANAGRRDDIFSGLAGFGSNLLGQYYQGTKPTTPTISLSDLQKLISGYNAN